MSVTDFWIEGFYCRCLHALAHAVQRQGVFLSGILDKGSNR